MAELLLATSWDDGHPVDRRLAELLARHAIPGTFFVPRRNCEGRPVMGPAELRSLMADGFELAAHTADHRRLRELTPEAARQQVADGRRYLEDVLGTPVQGFAYPGGHPGAHGRRIVAEAGFAYARTTELFCLAPGADKFAMPTTMHFHPHRFAAMARNWLRRGGGLDRLGLALRWLAAEALEPAVEALLATASRRGGVFHLWGHSWEIDAGDRWAALDRTLARLAAVIPASDRRSLRQIAR